MDFRRFSWCEKSAMVTERGGPSDDTSKLSAHQLPHAIETSPVAPGPLLIYWTLIDQSILLSGFEREFMAFSDQWEAAAERDDEKKSRWDNVKAAVKLH